MFKRFNAWWDRNSNQPPTDKQLVIGVMATIVVALCGLAIIATFELGNEKKGHEMTVSIVEPKDGSHLEIGTNAKLVAEIRPLGCGPLEITAVSPDGDVVKMKGFKESEFCQPFEVKYKGVGQYSIVVKNGYGKTVTKTVAVTNE